MPIRTYMIGSTTSYLEISNALFDSACVTDLKHFLYWFRPIRMFPHRKSKENPCFSSFETVLPLTDDRKLCKSHSSSSLFNHESAPSGLFIVRWWAPGRKIQYPLGSREPTPLGVQGRPVAISQNKPKVIIKHCAPDAFLFSDPI